MTSRFPGKVNLSNLIKKKNRPSLVSKRVQVTSTNGEGNLINNTANTSNGSNHYSNIKSDCDSDFNNSPSPIVQSSRNHENGHDAVSTSEKHTNVNHHDQEQQLQQHATQSTVDNCINSNTNNGKNHDICVNTCNRVSASTTANGKCTSNRQDIREMILNSKEMKASTGLSFFQSLANPSATASSSTSPNKSLDEDEDDDKFTFEGFSRDQVDANRRRILQEYDLLSTDETSNSSSSSISRSRESSTGRSTCDNQSTSSGSNYANCRSNLDDSTSSDSDDQFSNRKDKRRPLKKINAKLPETTTVMGDLSTNSSVLVDTKNHVDNVNQSDALSTTTSTSTAIATGSLAASTASVVASIDIVASSTVSSSPGSRLNCKNDRSSSEYIIDC